jgi:hypothetical protein
MAEEMEHEARYTVGQRVKLLPFPEGDDGDIGTITKVMEDDSMVEVIIDFAYRSDGDDGIRTIVYDDLVATGYGLTDEDAHIMVVL